MTALHSTWGNPVCHGGKGAKSSHFSLSFFLCFKRDGGVEEKVPKFWILKDQGLILVSFLILCWLWESYFLFPRLQFLFYKIGIIIPPSHYASKDLLRWYVWSICCVLGIWCILGVKLSFFLYHPFLSVLTPSLSTDVHGILLEEACRTCWKRRQKPRENENVAVKQLHLSSKDKHSTGRKKNPWGPGLIETAVH